MKLSSIKFKFAAGSIGIIILLGVALIAFVRVGLPQYLEQELLKKGLVLSKHFSSMVADSVLTKDYFSIQMQVLEIKNDDADIRYIIVSDHDGRVVAHTFGRSFPEDLMKVNSLEPGMPHNIETLVAEEGKIFDIATPILKGDAGMVRLGVSAEHVEQAVRDISNVMVLIILVVVFAGCFIAMLLGNAITEPLVKLKQMARAVGEGNLELKARVDSDDEVGHLAASFNLMTENLKSGREELQEANRELEEYSRRLENKVDRRTADLLASNERLEHEIIERKQAEKERVRSAQLASVGELAAGIAHEINNPLNGIINYAEILTARIQDEEQRNLADRIIMEGDRISRIVASLLSFTRLQSSVMQPVHLEELLPEILDLVGSQMSKEEIEVDSDFSPGLPFVIASPHQIGQVFLNLISNARQAINDKRHTGAGGGRIEVRGERVELDGTDYVRVTFCDHGAGIPADIVNRVMDPFFTTKGKKGTGLGLSISQSIVNDHGGKMEIESKEGEFTKVLIYLPSGIEKQRHEQKAQVVAE